MFADMQWKGATRHGDRKQACEPREEAAQEAVSIRSPAPEMEQCLHEV